MSAQFTLFFDGHLWVGVYEIDDGETLRAARVIFGKEPNAAELYEFVREHGTELVWRAHTPPPSPLEIRPTSPAGPMLTVKPASPAQPTLTAGPALRKTTPRQAKTYENPTSGERPNTRTPARKSRPAKPEESIPSVPSEWR